MGTVHQPTTMERISAKSDKNQQKGSIPINHSHS
nr:MAG TPA: hypothetical protein [Caudoviricetes sp.]